MEYILPVRNRERIFAAETIGEYRIELFNRLQFEADVWINDRMMRGMSN